MECPDGLERKCFPLLAMHVADHKEALKATATKMTHCTGCEAKQGELQMFGGTKFEKKTTAHMRQLYETRRVGVLDDCDHPLPGKAAEMGRIETEYYGCRYLFPCSRSLFCFFFSSFLLLFIILFVLLIFWYTSDSSRTHSGISACSTSIPSAFRIAFIWLIVVFSSTS